MAGNVKLNSASGGSVTLAIPETASSYTLTLPAANGVAVAADAATGAMMLPAGTTAQRPASPVAGQMRYNSTLGYSEVYTGAAWNAVGGNDIYAQYVAVAGGGGGGHNGGNGGGGGAGGFLAGHALLTAGTTYTITIGAGGASSGGMGNAGSATSFASFAISTGGGGGGGSGQYGGAGGSGGGGGQFAWGGGNIAGQGSGGGGRGDSGNGGGGGAGGTPSPAYIGGPGKANPITGSTAGQLSSGTYYLAGGGSGSGSGGVGGGGAASGGSGTANTGGGGGGGTAGWGGSGGSGVVVLSIPTSKYTGTTTGSPIVTTSGLNTILQFNSSGSYTA